MNSQFELLFGDGVRAQVLYRILTDKHRGVTVDELAEDVDASRDEIEEVVSDLRDVGAAKPHRESGLTTNRKASVGRLLERLETILEQQEDIQDDFDELSEVLS